MAVHLCSEEMVSNDGKSTGICDTCLSNGFARLDIRLLLHLVFVVKHLPVGGTEKP